LSSIRVTYSGLIAFIIGIISVFTGLVFVLIVTRQLSPEEFGTWSILGSMLSYFLISERVISYWTTRQIARGEDVGKTSVISSTTFSFGAIPFYLILVYYVSAQSNANLEPMLLATILLPIYFISQTLFGINTGHKPHATSYSLLAFEVFKIPVALLLVYWLDLGINGAITTVIIAYLLRISIQFYFAKPKIKEKFNFQILRRWLKFSWIPIYSHIEKTIRTVDVLLYTLITGSVIGVAYYTASLTVAMVVSHSALITQALYPKLLARGSYALIRENFILLMFFSIPLLGIAVIFAKPALFALNPLYDKASLIVIILSFRTFLQILGGTFGKILRGIEKVDVEKNPTFSGLTKSYLFSLPTVYNIQYGLYLAILVPLLFFLVSVQTSEIEIITWWAIIGLVIEIPVVIFLAIKVKKETNFSFPIRNTVKYLFSTLAFVTVFFLTSPHIIIYHQSIYDFMPTVIIQLVICVGVYIGITYLIDEKTRILFKSILKELKQ